MSADIEPFAGLQKDHSPRVSSSSATLWGSPTEASTRAALGLMSLRALSGTDYEAQMIYSTNYNEHTYSSTHSSQVLSNLLAFPR